MPPTGEIMKLIRGWEGEYAPNFIGGLRLSKARIFREAGEEDGIGDAREGEVRIPYEGKVTTTWDGPLPPMTKENAERIEADTAEGLQQIFADKMDDPNLKLEPTMEGGELILHQNVKVGDQNLGSPFLLCLSREPTTRETWERLQASLPNRYDTWTITENVEKLQFEVEWAIKRWMALNEITHHEIVKVRGWVVYPYEDVPPSGDASELLGMQRWFRKRRKYKNQEEYRLAWMLSSPQMETFPEVIDVELTRTGLNLFKTWAPPET